MNNNQNVNGVQNILNNDFSNVNNNSQNMNVNTNTINNNVVPNSIPNQNVSSVNNNMGNMSSNVNNNNNINNVNSNPNPVPLDNSTIDYNSLYNISNKQEEIFNNQISDIDQKIAEEQVINPEISAIEKSGNDNNDEIDRKGLTFVIILSVIILAIVIFLFPYLAKSKF